MTSSIVERAYWRFLRTVGLKRLSWDKQFQRGVWCRRPRSEHTVRRVMELCNGAVLVEFGAGEGALPRQLPPGVYAEYVGYDISSVAIRRAREFARQAGFDNCRFEICDMARWRGLCSVGLILVEECLYYLSPRRTESFLRHCCDSLCPDGNILVIVHSAAKHHRTLEICRRTCRPIDECVIAGRTFLTLARAES